jgi:DNA-binding response OmpR family regulator
MTSQLPTVVAILNTSPDTIQMLRGVLQQAGFVVVSAFIHDIRDGVTNLDAFLGEHQPAAIVYDVAVPYAENWRFFQHIRSRESCVQCQFVLTTTNAREVAKIAGAEQHLHEIVGKPYDLGEVARAVKEAVRARPIR